MEDRWVLCRSRLGSLVRPKLPLFITNKYINMLGKIWLRPEKKRRLKCIYALCSILALKISALSLRHSTIVLWNYKLLSTYRLLEACRRERGLCPTWLTPDQIQGRCKHCLPDLSKISYQGTILTPKSWYMFCLDRIELNCKDLARHKDFALVFNWIEWATTSKNGTTLKHNNRSRSYKITFHFTPFPLPHDTTVTIRDRNTVLPDSIYKLLQQYIQIAK